MLRKMVFGPRGRLSTDLDFTCRTDIRVDDLMLMMLEAVDRPYARLGSHSAHHQTGRDRSCPSRNISRDVEGCSPGGKKKQERMIGFFFYWVAWAGSRRIPPSFWGASKSSRSRPTTSPRRNSATLKHSSKLLIMSKIHSNHNIYYCCKYGDFRAANASGAVQIASLEGLGSYTQSLQTGGRTDFYRFTLNK